MFSLFSRKEETPPEQWFFLTTIKMSAIWGKTDLGIYMHFYDSSENNRVIHFTTDNSEFKNFEQLISWVKTTQVYNERLYRWLQGAPDPDVPEKGDLAKKFAAEKLEGAVMKPIHVKDMLDTDILSV